MRLSRTKFFLFLKMKKGFELSISVLVTIIIGIVLLVSGIVLLNKFISGSLDIKNQLDERTEQQLSDLMESGESVAIPFNTATIKRGDSKVVGLGIVNLEESTAAFSVSIVLSKAYDKNDAEMTPTNFDINKWVLYDGDKTLASKEQARMAILFMVPNNGESGTYVFDVQVNAHDQPQPYGGGIKKVNIIVP